MSEQAIRFSEAELELLRALTVAPSKLESILAQGGTEQEAMLSQDDAEELLGYIAAEANHVESRKVERALDRLYERVEKFERSFRDAPDA